MKKSLFALILMNTLSAFAYREQTVRITSDNIQLVEVSPTVCDKENSKVVTPALLILTLKDSRELIFKMITDKRACSSQAAELDVAAWSLADKIDTIQHEDIGTYERGNSLVCYKTVGLAIWNKEGNLASTFRTNMVTVVCPK